MDYKRRVEHRRRVADTITQHIVSTVHEDMGVSIRAYANPEKGKIWIEDNSGHRIEHNDIRFCCTYHCWYDIEQDAAVQILDKFAYMLVKVIKLNDPPNG